MDVAGENEIQGKIEKNTTKDLEKINKGRPNVENRATMANTDAEAKNCD